MSDVEEKRSWPEDYANGSNQYEVTCSFCGNHFYGHKRRPLCRVCDASLNSGDIVERLTIACNGHPFSRIPWPHRDIHEAISAIKILRAERDIAFLEGVKAGLEAAKEAVAKEGMRPHAWDDDYGFGLDRALVVVKSIDPATITRKGTSHE